MIKKLLIVIGLCMPLLSNGVDVADGTLRVKYNGPTESVRIYFTINLADIIAEFRRNTWTYTTQEQSETYFETYEVLQYYDARKSYNANKTDNSNKVLLGQTIDIPIKKGYGEFVVVVKGFEKGDEKNTSQSYITGGRLTGNNGFIRVNVDRTITNLTEDKDGPVSAAQVEPIEIYSSAIYEDIGLPLFRSNFVLKKMSERIYFTDNLADTVATFEQTTKIKKSFTLKEVE